jgi:hypothetical protein
MGNCATCCGKADGNEIMTEKAVTRAGVKGVQNENYSAGIDREYPDNNGSKL